jgi:SNF2 family DNA or RNA helicase
MKTQLKSSPKSKKGKKTTKKKLAIPYHKKPENLSIDQWQLALRKQFATTQNFKIENIGQERVFSDYHVYNPSSKNTYKIALRSNPKQVEVGENYNFCTCYDFKTNGLGTCKHIESVINQISKKRELKSIYTKQVFSPTYSSVYLKYTPEGRVVMLRIGSENEGKIRKLSSTYFTDENCLKPTAYSNFDEFLMAVRKLNSSFRCYDDALSYVFEIRERNKRKAWVWKNKEVLRKQKFSDYVNVELHPYQKEGAMFAIQAGRVMIADEMGLGKTLQAIATAEVMKKEFGINKVLVVCPTSLKYQWKSEIEKFTHSSAQVVEGLHHKRILRYEEGEEFYQIIGHHTVGNDLEAINNAGFDLIILDEAQRIKNWQAKISQNIKKLSSEYAIVLTGTPLENKLEELYSVTQFIDPFRLGALYRFLHNHQIADPETGKVIGYKDLNQVGELLSDILIRRTKNKVLTQLPSRQDKNLFVPMTREQQIIHDECYDLVTRLVSKWRKMGFLPEKDRQRLMINLNMMRMACNSTFILDQRTRHETKIQELMGILESIFSMENEKVVIFSQWERMTRLVAWELDALGIKYEYLHGGVPSDKRKDLLENFRDTPESKVFLSTDAGGVGLNLQSAAYLINLDIPWNPAVLEQRIGRIYRMGQKKKVSIINLVSTGTIEHKMLDVLKFKSSMAAGVLDAGDDTIMMQEDRFKQFMQSVESMVEVPLEPTITIEEEETLQPEQDIYRSDTPESGSSGHQLPLFGTDSEKEDNAIQEPQQASPSNVSSEIPGLFGQLAKMLADPQQSQALAKSITETDPSTGQSYLKMPVENPQAVEDILKGVSQLFKMIDFSKIK